MEDQIWWKKKQNDLNWIWKLRKTYLLRTKIRLNKWTKIQDEVVTIETNCMDLKWKEQL